MDRDTYALKNFIGIMKSCRRQLIEDAINGNTDLFKFLYEDKNPALKELYEKRYELKWRCGATAQRMHSFSAQKLNRSTCLLKRIETGKRNLKNCSCRSCAKQKFWISKSWRLKLYEHEQKLRQEEAKFQQELALENRRRNAEIDALIAEKEIERGTKITEAIAAYQKTMAECSVEIGNSLGMMNIELRERAAALVEEKQLASIIENSDKFMQTISDDFARMMDSVRQITEKTIDNANQYISPTFARAMTGSTGQRQIE